jgi:hypothetical protein
MFDSMMRAGSLSVWVSSGAREKDHTALSRPGEPTALNFQNRKGKIPSYQAHQLIAMIDKYEEKL